MERKKIIREIWKGHMSTPVERTQERQAEAISRALRCMQEEAAGCSVSNTGYVSAACGDR